MMSNPLVIYMSTGLLIALFLLLFFCLRLPKKARQLGHTALSVLVIFGDVSLNDEQKETQIQLITLQLLGRLLLFLASIACAFLAPLLVLHLLETAEITSSTQVIERLLSLPFLLLSTLVAVLLWRRVRSRHGSGVAKVGKGFEVRYTGVEKVLHLLAFATRDIQVLVSKLEDKLLLKPTAQQPHQPVFISGLPRAGTTLLMDLCFNTGAFATHTYRDMPFVLVPLLWRKFSNRFMRKSSEVERSHGDGMLVNLDSPEAFEEVLWMTYWQDQYHNQQISTWPPYCKSRFDDFFIRHQHKLAATLSSGGVSKRYLSKNNLNIARVEFVLEMIPDAKFVIPFRQPTLHCQSLRRQHVNFLDIHSQDEFSRLYMAGIGHFDFGHNLKPVNFEQWLSTASAGSAEELTYWYEYWCACYAHLLSIKSDRVCFVDFDRLCQQPERELNRIADFIGLEDRALLVKQAGLVEARATAADDFSHLSAPLASKLSSVYYTLQMRATTQSSCPDSQ